MLIDTIVEIDSPVYADTEYQPGNELIVFLRNSRDHLIVHDVSIETFVKLYKNPTHATMQTILKTHRVFIRYVF